jgi:hypothetical protein
MPLDRLIIAIVSSAFGLGIGLAVSTPYMAVRLAKCEGFIERIVFILSTGG